jgi:hypothetical protein
VQHVFTNLGTNCSPPLGDLFLYSHEVKYIHGLLKKTQKDASPIV